ncbi:DUF4012 domain-containing protein [Microbacterium suwonense]|uniref:DUF4012 domain-containing protein n=1 Tax=Microbacterium suwonense TaxID=683047 RepID=A0ABM8FU58_9MICO|nr:DUF4012 domain-containing protein [Microbacterium suwonense]BDZ39213.1 hypothetical protein GCM10025863_18270 [Microbacterium suwonense]
MSKRRRTIIWWSVAGVLVVLLAVGGLAGKRVYDQAIGVRGHLEAAMTEVQSVQKAVLAGDSATATVAADRLSVHTAAAVSGSQGRLWSLGAALPFVGSNLTAVSQVARVTDGLARDVVTPASRVNLKSLVPEGGQVDIKQLSSLSDLLDTVSQGLDTAKKDIGKVDRSALIGPVANGVKRLDDSLEKLQPYIQPAKDVLSVLPDALGASGPRNYLLMFQGNSEARSLGGNAAVDIVLRAEDGRLSIIQTANSQEFHGPSAEPVAPLDPEAVAIYGDKIGHYVPDFTMVPDFPTAAKIFDGWWKREFDTPYNAVMSVDPVALSYILGATGPVTLPTGDVLSADNAVSLLLNEVYFRYSDPEAQNMFFGAAADAVFTAVTSGKAAPLALVSAVVKSADEGRLLYTSSDAKEAALVAPLRMSGVMPHDNTEKTVVGAYVNDNTGSKKSYYLDLAVSACATDSTVKTHTELTSSLTADEAKRLPYYITGGYFAPSDISSYVVLYGPVGATLQSITLDGRPASVLSSGQHLGRPAVKVEVFNHLTSTHSLDAAYSMPAGTQGPLSIWHTPMVRATPISTNDTCAG